MLGTPKRIYKLTTTALYSGNITVNIDYSAIMFTDESSIKLIKLTSSGWIDITDSEYPDTINDLIQGTIDTLSYFAIVEPSDVAQSVLDRNTAAQSMLDTRGRAGTYIFYFPETFSLETNVALTHTTEPAPERSGGYVPAQYTTISLLRDDLPWDVHRADKISIHQEGNYFVDNIETQSRWLTKVAVTPWATTTTSTTTTTTTTSTPPP